VSPPVWFGVVPLPPAAACCGGSDTGTLRMAAEKVKTE